MFSTNWLMQQDDLDLVSDAFSEIYDCFDAHSGVYGCLWNYKSLTTLDSVTSRIAECEWNNDWATFFYYGHMGERPIQYGLKSYGFHIQGSPVDQNSVPEDTIWDTSDIYPNTVNGRFHFVFLWVCNNGKPVPEYPPGTGSPVPVVHGPAFCWTQQWDLSLDGYGSSDQRGYCFISFEGASVTLMETMNAQYLYKDWLVAFYNNALSYGRSIHDSLYWASRAVGYSGWAVDSNPLYHGDQYIWWGGAGIPYGTYSGKMRVYGDAVGVYL